MLKMGATVKPCGSTVTLGEPTVLFDSLIGEGPGLFGEAGPELFAAFV